MRLAIGAFLILCGLQMVPPTFSGDWWVLIVGLVVLTTVTANGDDR